MIAGAVEEADLSVETPIRAVGGVSTKALAFGCFFNVVEVADFRLHITYYAFELLAACIRD